MKGQWIGNYSGTNSGKITIELDEKPNNYVGWAYLYDSADGYPCSAARIETPDKSKKQLFTSKVMLLHPNNGNILNRSELNRTYPSFHFPGSADVNFELGEDNLDVNWRTRIDTSGKASLPKSKANLPSVLNAKQLTTWDDFKKAVSVLPMRHYVFRGQKTAKWRLRTSFHRGGRSDLRTFNENDIRELHASTINLTKHRFVLENSLDLGAFYALLQHHGYPTPLQDWTYSPYVAAYFAFKDVQKMKKGRMVNVGFFHSHHVSLTVKLFNEMALKGSNHIFPCLNLYRLKINACPPNKGFLHSQTLMISKAISRC